MLFWRYKEYEQKMFVYTKEAQAKSIRNEIEMAQLEFHSKNYLKINIGSLNKASEYNFQQTLLILNLLKIILYFARQYKAYLRHPIKRHLHYLWKPKQ